MLSLALSSLHSGTSYSVLLACNLHTARLVPEPGQASYTLLSQNEKSPPQRRTNFNAYSMLPIATHYLCDGDRMHYDR